MKKVSFAVNYSKLKRSLTEYGAYPYAAGDLFAFDGKKQLPLNNNINICVSYNSPKTTNNQQKERKCS